MKPILGELDAAEIRTARVVQYPRGGRPALPASIRRSERLQVQVTPRDMADLRRIGEAWGVPAATACYFIMAARLAELRGEGLDSMGGDWMASLGAWLRGLGHDETD